MSIETPNWAEWTEKLGIPAVTFVVTWFWHIQKDRDSSHRDIQTLMGERKENTEEIRKIGIATAANTSTLEVQKVEIAAYRSDISKVQTILGDIVRKLDFADGERSAETRRRVNTERHEG